MRIGASPHAPARRLLLVCSILLASVAAPAVGQEPAPPPQPGAAPPAQPPAATQPPPAQAPAAQAQAQAPAQAPPPAQPQAPAATPAQAPAAAPAPPPAAPPPAPAPPPTQAATIPPPPAAPGTPPPGEPAPAERALSRTLVEQGGLLLEPGRFELSPEVSYAHSDEDLLFSGEGVAVTGATRRFTGTVTLRLGLPLRLQAEGEVPFVWARQSAIRGGEGARPAAEESGIGDVRAALTWHAYRGGEGGADVLLNGFWKSRTGRTPLDAEDPARVPLGTGIQQVGGGISIVKALDPVVLLGAVNVGYGIPRRLVPGWLATGPELEITTSAILAVSPETSLSFGLEQSYSGDARLAGEDVPDTAQTAAVFNVGFATLASRWGLIQTTIGIGLTGDVPRFQVSLGFPIAF